MARYYPAFLNVEGLRAVVVGGGVVAERKAAQLLASGADVTLVSPDATPELERLAGEGRVRLIRRAYAPGDLAGAWIAVAATDDPETQRAIRAESLREKTLLNVADEPELCGFIAPSVVERGPVAVAISTGGESPALARRLRELMGGEREQQDSGGSGGEPFCRCLQWADAGEDLAAVRAELRAEGKSAPPEAWQEAMDEEFLRLALEGKSGEARRKLRAALPPREA